MSFSIDTRKFARIRSFSDAEAYFNNTPAIRGWDKALVGVPLRSDRKDWREKSLRRLNDGSYALRLYRTDVVVYHSDWRIVVDISYNSHSTNEFAGALTPYDLNFSSIFGNPVVHVDGGFYLASKPMEFIKEAGHGYKLVNPDRYAVTKQALNRKRAKAVREMLQPLMEFAKVMRGMEPLEESAVASVPSIGIRALDVSEEDITNPDNFMMFLRPYYMTRWFNGVRETRLHANAEKDITEGAYHRFGAYDRVPLPQGIIHKTMQYAN